MNGIEERGKKNGVLGLPTQSYRRLHEFSLNEKPLTLNCHETK
jgi:hypothetical protein